MHTYCDGVGVNVGMCACESACMYIAKYRILYIG